VNMATFTNKEIIDEMIENDGYYQGDDPPVAIFETYNTMSKKTQWVVCYVEADITRMYQSDIVTNIKQLWPK